MGKLANGVEYTKEEHNRDMNPTAPARVAQLLFSEKYGKQCYGVMGFYDRLTEFQKKQCETLAKNIKELPME